MTTGFNALPDYNSTIVRFSQDVVEQIRLDLKENEFNNSLDSKVWRSTLPYPLNTMDNYPALRSLLRYKGTSRFWLVLSSMYGVPFYVFDHRKVLSVEEALLIKNEYPDLINNISPYLIPGYILGYTEYRNYFVNNVKPRLINNEEPDTVANTRPPEGYQDNYYYVYIFFPKALSKYTQEEVGTIRKDIRKLVEYFCPPDKEISNMVNIFP
jgi:hypothetical protein